VKVLVTKARRTPNPSVHVGVAGALASSVTVPRSSDTVRLSTRLCAFTIWVFVPMFVTRKGTVRWAPCAAVTDSWVRSTSRLSPLGGGVP
jgi:hypothetical protein